MNFPHSNVITCSACTVADATGCPSLHSVTVGTNDFKATHQSPIDKLLNKEVLAQWAEQEDLTMESFIGACEKKIMAAGYTGEARLILLYLILNCFHSFHVSIQKRF